MVRIITHSQCLDGFHSAFLVIRYVLPFFGVEGKAEVVPVSPAEVELGQMEFEPTDIVVDLPQPQQKVWLWADHHTTSDPFRSRATPSSEIAEMVWWRDAPSCTGLIVDELEKRGANLPGEVGELKKVIDKTDTAGYTISEYEECFVNFDFENASLLAQTMMIGSLFSSRDNNLSREMFKGLLELPLGIVPSQGDFFGSPLVRIAMMAHLKNMKEWREVMDSNFMQDPRTKVVIQDERKIKFRKGTPDRFYVSYKFRDSSYSISIREKEPGQCVIGIGKNVFAPGSVVVDVGKLCRKVGRKFGEGSGGGHRDVGGCMVAESKVKDAIEFILEEIYCAES